MLTKPLFNSKGSRSEPLSVAQRALFRCAASPCPSRSGAQVLRTCTIFRPVVVCTAQPSRKKGQIRYKLKQAIEHAQNLCTNFEDTPECRIAWDEVNDLTRALHDQKPPPSDTERTEISKREYDV